jgi:tetratricopeptide (TPR) repeat protein
VSLGGCAWLLLRRATLRQLGPAAALVASQALWFSIPVALRLWNVRGLEPIDANPEYYFLWIGVAHAVQYLWVTSYYARASPRWTGQLRYYAKAALAGALIWTVPSLVFAPGALGRLPFDAGLAALIAAAVNLQHFILDGAIWKLRDGRIARILIRSAPADDAEPQRSGWTRRAVWAVGAACVALMSVYTWESVGLYRAVRRDDLTRVERAMARIAWLGRDSARYRLALGDWHMKRDEPESALPQFERAVELLPSAQAWRAVGTAHARRASWPEASRAYEAALGFAPDDPGLLHAAALAWLERGELERARRALERAASLDPDRRDVRSLLRRLDAESPTTLRPSVTH